VFSNCLAILIARSVWAISVFATLPVIVRGIGAESLGIWESILAVGATAAVLQTVTGGTLLWQMSHQVGADNVCQVKRLIRLGITSTLLMFLMFVPLTFVYREAVLDVLRVSPMMRDTAAWLLPATVGLLALGGFNQTLMSALAGLQRSGTAAGIQVAGLIVNSAANVVAIWCGVGIIAMWYGALAGFLVTFTSLVVANWRAYRGISLVPVLPSRRELAVLVPFASLLLVSNVTILCRDHLDKIILTVIDSASTTGYFAIAQRLTSIILHVSVVVQLPLTAAIGASHARGDWLRIERIYSQASHWSCVISCLAALIICSLRTPLLIAWFGHDIVDLHGYLAATIWGATVAISLASSGVALAKGVGRPGLETCYAVVTLLLTIASKPVLIYTLGPVGTVISSAVSWGMGSLLLLLIVHRETKLPNVLFRRNTTVVGLAALSSMALWNLSTKLPLVQHRGAATVVLLIGTGLVCLFYWALLQTFRVAPSLLELISRVGIHSAKFPAQEKRAA
jgi:O-antigen/teichoic acid export membrane protein